MPHSALHFLLLALWSSCTAAGDPAASRPLALIARSWLRRVVHRCAPTPHRPWFRKLCWLLSPAPGPRLQWHVGEMCDLVDKGLCATFGKVGSIRW